jgi:hypothetical protein
MRYTKNKKLLPTSSKKRRLLLIVGIVIALALVIFAILELTSTTHLILHRNTGLESAPNTPHRTANSNTKGEPADSGSQPVQNSTTTPAQQDDKEKSGQPQADADLLVPTGTFVSNHRPNLSGKPAPNQIQSVCVTTPGATCTIVFTKNGVSKQLPNQVTDRGGAAYWTWKLQDIDLTTGTWQVTAKATLGSHTETANDATALEVSQ